MFREACLNGHLNVIQWLYEIKSLIDTSNENSIETLFDIEDAFFSACVNGYLNIAKWLYKIEPSIDISANDNYTFFITCQKII